METLGRREGKEPIAEYGDRPREPVTPQPPLRALLDLAEQAVKVKPVRLTAAPAAPGAPGAPINKNDRWLTEPHKWRRVSTVEEADAALRSLPPAAGGRRPQLSLPEHVQLGDAALQPYSGRDIACCIRAYEAAGVLKDNNGRLYMHSDDLAAAEAVPIYGPYAKKVFIGSALAVEEQRPGYRVLHVQIIVTQPSVGGLHQDSGGGDGASVCKGPASLRAISRASVLLAPQQAQEEGLGCLGFSTTSSGARGGVSIDLTRSTLFATKEVLGKGSPYHHQVQVEHGGIASGLYALVAEPQGPPARKRKRLQPFEEMMAEERARPGQLQPRGDPPADVVRDLERGVFEARTTGGEMELLHSFAAAGAAGGTASMAKEGLTETGKSKRAFDMGTEGGKAAWELNRERMLEGAKAGGEAAVKKAAGAMADKAGHGAKNAKLKTCYACAFIHRSKAGNAAELAQAVAESQQGAYPCQQACVGHPLSGGLPNHEETRLSRHISKGRPCTHAALQHLLRRKGKPRGRKGGNQQSMAQRAATAQRRKAVKQANKQRHDAKKAAAAGAAEREQREQQRQAELAARAAARQQRAAEREQRELQHQTKRAATAAARQQRAVEREQRELQRAAEREQREQRRQAKLAARAAALQQQATEREERKKQQQAAEREVVERRRQAELAATDAAQQQQAAEREQRGEAELATTAAAQQQQAAEREQQGEAELAATAAAQQKQAAEREQREQQRQAELAATAAARRRRVAAREAERQRRLQVELEAEDARDFAHYYERAAQEVLLEQGWQLLPPEHVEWNPMKAAELELQRIYQRAAAEEQRQQAIRRQVNKELRLAARGLSSGRAQRRR